MDGAPSRALTPGTVIDGYRLGERVGGGFGVVYAVTDASGGRFALKTLRVWDGADAEQSARFAREARVANDIEHPAIVKVLATGTLDDGRPYLVMPLLEGRTLQEAIHAGRGIAPDRAWRLLRPVAEALARAHALGIVHRDVKPANVFLSRDEAGEETPHLLDFGLAHAIDSAESEEIVKLTQSGVLVGTPAYMAPEQWWGLPVSPAVDQYVLGATLYESLAGCPPFTEVGLRRLMEQTLHAPAPAPSAAGAPTSPAVDAFVTRLLAKEPGDRFASMEAVLEAGDAAFGAGETLDARTELADAPAASVAPDPAPREPDTSGGEPHPARARRLPGPLSWHAAVVVVGFGALVGAGYAGPAPRDVADWLHIGGAVQIGVLFFFAIGFVAIPHIARRRPGEPARGALALALAPALSGTFGVYTNWKAVEASLARTGGIDALRVFCEGTYESNAVRFLGFAVSAILCASLAALPSAVALAAPRARTADPSRATPSGPQPAPIPPSERQARAAALLALLALAVAAALLGAPSGAWIAAIAALTVAGTTLFGGVPAQAQLASAAASLCAVLLAFAAGLARVEAREAVLWSEPATRAARVAEILDARAEMNATLLLGTAAFIGAAAPVALALARAARRGSLPRLSRIAWVGIALVVASAGFDLWMRDRFLRRREDVRAELTPQFATFAHLDPPPADGLAQGPEHLSPHRSTGLQIGRDAVAVNGRGIARLAALDSETGLFQATAVLHQALAQAAVERGADEVDLSITADESVAFGHIVRLLSVARAGGARKVELLFRRGPKPHLPPDSPPETAYVVPSDFIAIEAELAAHGFEADAAEPWSRVAPRLLRDVSPDAPLRLRVP
ncbi:MAG: serine/threonine-protein kinase [Polyangiaceae bacterium]